MPWRKLGLVYAPSGELWWAQRYAFLPAAEVVSDAVIRVYCASLDEQMFGRIGYVEVDARDPTRIVAVASEPILDLGELGTFDDSGVTPACVLNVGGAKYLYYFGWQRAERVPYMYFSSVAVSHDAGVTFEKYSRVPILDRTADDPFSRSVPCVIRDGGIYRMWYCSCIGWTADEHGVRYNNVIRYAESADGIQWQAAPAPCLTPLDDGDYSIGRPWVVRDEHVYRMWYSTRSLAQPYRIGYAESDDGLAWRRLDEQAGISRSDHGWDSEMICYPCVVDTSAARYLFYNGNRHGSTGFGVAVWAD